MTRKNLLGGLMNAPAAPATPAPPRPVKGAVGAMSRSLADLRARAVVEIDPFLIDGSSLRDRLEMDPAEDAALARSIATYGQQVPVLVRPHPTAEGRFQIVYGRRRVLALRDLNQPVKALVRELDDRDLALAQGQENTARRDLSFIEKAVFAQQMVGAGFDRTIICDALMIDKTVVSRMLSVAERIPFPVVEAIGSAPSIGRDRWVEAAELWSVRNPDVEDMLSILSLAQKADTSDDRFMALLQHLHGVDSRHKAAEAAATRAPDTVNTHEGWPMGEVKRTGTSLTLSFKRRRTQGFEDWLVDALPDLFARWQNDQPEGPQD